MYHFHSYVRDEQFDLLTDELPDNLFFLLGDQLRRARAVLKSRNHAEITYAIESLDWMLKAGGEHLFEETMETLKTQDDAFIDRVKALRALMPHIDLDDQVSFPNATWAEYFAVLTLLYIAEALQPENWSQTSESGQAHSISSDWATEAMEAVAYAEALMLSKRTENAALSREKKKRASIAKKAGDASHEKTRVLLKKLHKFYMDNAYTQYSDAVHDFLSQTPEADYRHLAPTNRERTLRNGLSRIIRGKLVL